MPCFAEPVRPPAQLKSEGSTPALTRRTVAEAAPAVAPAPLPAPLRSGAEALGGFSLADVRVHRDSPEPAKLGALGFARGSDIHLGPGQERHLPHEAWHVVQQKQGRVTATTQLKAIGIDDDAALEAEADRLGSVAAGEVAASETLPKQESIVEPKARPQSALPRGSADRQTIDDAALQPAEQLIGDDHATRVKKAKERVKKEADDNFNGDYLVAYLDLRRDPTLWEEVSHVKSDTKSYVYLPSYDSPEQPVHFEVPFEFYAKIGIFTGDGMNYPEVTMSDVLEHLDPVSAQSIRKGMDSKTVQVTIEAMLALDSFKDNQPTRETTDTLEPIAIADVTKSSESLVPSGFVGRDKLSKTGRKLYRLTGTVIATGTEKLGQEGITQVGGTKEKAVKGKFP